jgi:hypothetical protein
MSELCYPDWQKPYHDALLELNPEKLIQLVSEAERAILSRLQEIRLNSDNRLEVQAIEDAINGLRVLKNETVMFKSSQSASVSVRYNAIGAESD